MARQVINDIVDTIVILSNNVESLSSDFGDASYDKSQEIKLLFFQTLENISKLQFESNDERQVIKNSLVTQMRPAVQKLKQFFINRRNFLSAEYDVLSMNEQLSQGMAQADSNVYNFPTQDNTNDNSKDMSNSQEMGRARVLANGPHNHFGGAGSIAA